MNRYWIIFANRFAQFRIREKWLIIGTGFVVVLFLCDTLLWGPLRSRTHQLQLKTEQVQQQLGDLQRARETTTLALRADPDLQLRAQLDQIQSQITEQDKALAQLTVGLVRPDIMARVLRDLLVSRKGLKLISLANGRAQPAFAPLTQDMGTQATRSEVEPTTDTTDVSDSAESDISVTPVIYKHALSLTFRGSYFEVVDYLQAIEKLPWHFFWESLDYSVDHYPQAEVTLKVYTLGDKEAWIGA